MSRTDRFAIGLSLFATIAWWIFSSLRSALGLVIPRDAVAYGVGAIVFFVGVLTIRRLPGRASVVSLGVFSLYTVGQFLARDDFRKVQIVSLIQIVFPIAFFWIGYLLWRHRRYALPLQVYVGAMAFSVLMGLANYYTGFAEPLFLLSKLDRAEVGSVIVQRGSSLASNSIGTGLLAALAILVTFGLPRRFWLVAPIFALSLLSTLSRGGIIAIASGLPILLWFRRPTLSPERARALRVRATLVAAALVAALVVVSSSSSKDAGPNLFLSRYVGDLFDSKEEGNSYRIASWTNDIEVWSEDPVFGSGLGVLGTIGVVEARLNGKEALAAESWYLQILGEMGVVGLGLYLFMLFAILTDAWQAAKLGPRGPDHSLAVGVLSGMAALVVGGIFLQNLSDVIGSLFWYFAGGLVAYRSELNVEARTSVASDGSARFPDSRPIGT